LPVVETLTTKVVQRGSEWVLVLDENLLRDLRIDADTALKVTTDGHSLVISPADPKRQESFRRAADDTFNKYPDMLRRLAQ
jgi:hypothetical protein